MVAINEIRTVGLHDVPSWLPHRVSAIGVGELPKANAALLKMKDDIIECLNALPTKPDSPGAAAGHTMLLTSRHCSASCGVLLPTSRHWGASGGARRGHKKHAIASDDTSKSACTLRRNDDDLSEPVAFACFLVEGTLVCSG